MARNGFRAIRLLWTMGNAVFINSFLRSTAGEPRQLAYPFINIAVLDGVRERLAAGDAVVLLDLNAETILFANGAGARLCGFDNPVEITGLDADLGPSAKRQIQALDVSHGPASLALRLTDGFSSRIESVIVARVLLPDGKQSFMLSQPAKGGIANAIEGLASDGSHAAIIDGSGSIIAASHDFASLGIPAADLTVLAAHVSGESDRMVKRLIRTGRKVHPAGIGRISDDPEQHLLLVIEDRTEVAELEDLPSSGQTAGETSIATDQLPVDRLHVQGDRFAGTVSLGGQQPSDPDPARLPLAANQTSPAPAATLEPPKAPAIQIPDSETPPVRFTWRIDAAGFFRTVSQEFATAVGPHAADLEGRTFAEVAQAFALDPTGDIRDLLERHDTWSGRSVLWPMEGTSLRAPVDLAALPVYDRERRFEGFRGFGIVRLADAEHDPEGLGLAMAKPAQTAAVPEPMVGNLKVEDSETLDDPWRGGPQALEIQQPPKVTASDKVINLEERRQPRERQPEAGQGGLSAVERSAFREIAERLRREGLAAAQSEVPEVSPPVPADALTSLPVDAPIAVLAEHTVVDDAQFTEASADELMPEQDLQDLADATDDLLRLDGASQTENTNYPEESGSAHPAEEDQARVINVANESTAEQLPEPIDEAPILSRLPVPVLVHTGSDLLFANQSFFDLTGYPTLAALQSAGGLDALFEHPGQQDASGVGQNSLLRTAYDKAVPVKAHLHSVPWKRGHALLLSMRTLDQPIHDASQDESLKSALAEMKQEVDELSSVLETATDGVVFINSDGTIRTITQSAEALFGFDPAELRGKPFAILFATESQRAINDYLANLSGTGVASLMNDGREVIGREAHGRFIPLFMTIGKLNNAPGYCAVMRDITHWKRAEEELSAAKRAAEHASTQKSEFLARVSHEIRTPLNAIIGFSDLMTEERFGPVGNLRYLDYLKDINRSGKHVLDLVNDLLDISKIEAGEQEMDFEAVSLNDALADAVSMLQPQANRNRVIIRSSFASDLPEVVADQRSVKQIALNLLSNAVRYTAPGGQVIVSTSYELTGGVAIRVRDTGVGMTAQEIEQAMKPFKQINALNRNRGDGTGLGLPLTKAMVEANRANFAITSTPGQGTLVEIVFPSTRVLAD
jgi:PAS domain S-box-containing protein